MSIRTAGAEKTGEWESPIWILHWIGEKANDARTADGKKTDEWESRIWILSRIEGNESAVGSVGGF